MMHTATGIIGYFSQTFQKIQQYQAAETIRATVVGAGTHTTNVSGSTISYARDKLPVKNIPVFRLTEEEEQDKKAFLEAAERGISLYGSEGAVEQMALAFSGKYQTGFRQI